MTTNTTTVRFLLSSNALNLAGALAGLCSVTVEAEYGSEWVEGTMGSLAHHGPRAGGLCPCLAENGCFGEGVEAVGLSHVDLDSLGGCLAVIGRKPEAPSFWELAAFVDVNGAHKLGLSGASEADLRSLHAWWAWSDAHKQFAPRDGSVIEVGEWIEAAAAALNLILSGDEQMLISGDEFKAQGDALNSASLVRVDGDVLVRKSDRFVNHLYSTPEMGETGTVTICRSVVSLNPKTGSITVSFADTPKGVSACFIVQALWGEKAGGHAGIAGSPRDRVMTEEDLEEAVKAVQIALVV